MRLLPTQQSINFLYMRDFPWHLLLLFFQLFVASIRHLSQPSMPHLQNNLLILAQLWISVNQQRQCLFQSQYQKIWMWLYSILRLLTIWKDTGIGEGQIGALSCLKSLAKFLQPTTLTALELQTKMVHKSRTWFHLHFKQSFPQQCWKTAATNPQSFPI